MIVKELEIDKERVVVLHNEITLFIQKELSDRLFRKNLETRFTPVELGIAFSKLAIATYALAVGESKEVGLTLGMQMYSNMTKNSLEAGCPCTTCSGAPFGGEDKTSVHHVRKEEVVN